ncbi:MAG: glycosyltransferase family 4 protein [Chloroflexi bacterium]|nr:glycosyltransferase family 4 protein [Chloroflexota bacterium]
MTTTVLSWVRRHRRNELLAERLGATLHDICYGTQGNLWQAPDRYPLQAWKTWRVLRQEQPDVVLAVNPPIFCALTAYLYSRRYGAQFAIDSHTGAFHSMKWGWSVRLQRFLARRALITIAHNKSQGDIVKTWGCRYTVVGFTPGTYPEGETYPLGDGFHVAVISSFLGDEPVDVVFEAARHLDDVTFHMTGDYRLIARRLLAAKPDNIHLTGYMPYARFVGLVRGVDATMVLTTRNHTLLMGGFEAVSLGSPLITSNWPILQEYFSMGTVHVPNTVEGLIEGVRRAQRERDTLRQDIVRLREKLEQDFERGMAEVQQAIREFEAEHARLDSDAQACVSQPPFDTRGR